MALFELKNISVGYADYPLISNLSLTLDLGDILSVVGQNASGKSSLIKAIFGQEAWMKGAMHYKGNAINNFTRNDISNRNIAWMLQSRPIFPGLKVIDILRALYKKGNKASFEKTLVWLSNSISPLKDIIEQEAQVLSGGEKAAFSLAMTLINRPHLIFLDEPFAGVDKNRIEGFVQCLNNYVRLQPAACLLIEHRADVVSKLGCQTLDLDAGTQLSPMPL